MDTSGTTRSSQEAEPDVYSNAGGLVHDIGDPYVLQHDGAYYLYGTGGDGIRAYRSEDLVQWTGPCGATDGYALSPHDSWGTWGFWAPEVVERDGIFTMHYTVEEHLAVATSDNPLGPFRQAVKEPLHPDTKEIDPHLFVDEDGQAYLYFVRFDQGNIVCVAEMEDDWLTVRDHTLRECLRQSQPWECHAHYPACVNEGAFVLKHKGLYYLTYSANHFMSQGYGVGYAIADNPMGPWTKHPDNPILCSDDTVHGAGHHSITASPDLSEMFIVYHTHYDLTEAQPRKMAIDRARFAPDPDGGPDLLVVDGPTLAPQPAPSRHRERPRHLPHGLIRSTANRHGKPHAQP